MGIIPKVRHKIREKKLRTAASEKKPLVPRDPGYPYVGSVVFFSCYHTR